MYYIYILHSTSLDKFYVGHANDLRERVARHNRGGNKFTSKGQSWNHGIMVYHEEFPTKELAYACERQIKKWKSKLMIQKLIDKTE